MKRAIIALCLMFLVGGLAGCSGLQAKDPMSTQMAFDATKAVTIGTPTPTVARAYLLIAQASLAQYYTAATTNPFAYWFGGKTIYADATFMLDLQRTALDATEVAKRAVTLSDEFAVSAAAAEAQEIINYNKARQGIK
jgi:hypothetical protein